MVFDLLELLKKWSIEKEALELSMQYVSQPELDAATVKVALYNKLIEELGEVLIEDLSQRIDRANAKLGY